MAGTNYNTGNDSRDFDIDGPEGWWVYNHSGASGTPVIAVIDGGFRIDHVDLINKWRTSPTGEYGWNFMEPPPGGSAINSTTITCGDPALIWHGTAVAGLAAGENNNGYCLAGTHWSAKIMPIVCDGSEGHLFSAIQYAHAEGADIVNMSFGDFASHGPTATLIAQMHNEGVLFFTAAGNGNEDEARDNWPSDYPHVVMVGGTGPDNRRFYLNAGCGSAWGTGVAVSAPAVHLRTLGDASNHALSYDVWGCSFACPKVAGLAGLLWAKYGPVSTGADADEIVHILKCGVSDIDGDVTNPTGSSSDPQEGEDDLGLGRPSMFKTMTGPRVKKVAVSQRVDRILTDGDLDGDGILNVTDWDLDGDGFSNLNDENDDGDGEMDGAAGGADTDDDGDLLANGSEDENGSRWNAPGEGTLILALTFNESMGLEEGSTIFVSPQDPDVKLVLTDGSELTFTGNAGGDTDWPFEHELNLDTWRGEVELDASATAKAAGDVRLRVSNTVDLAGDDVDCDVVTPGAQPYEYPLTMPGFRPNAGSPNAGVEKNTTALGQGVWPMAWGVVDVVGRGFNTDVSDPLSVQSMQVTIERGYDNQTVVSGAPMARTERDFTYEWDTVADGDSEYEVTLKAYDGGSGSVGMRDDVDTPEMCNASCRHPTSMVGTWAMQEGVGV